VEKAPRISAKQASGNKRQQLTKSFRTSFFACNDFYLWRGEGEKRGERGRLSESLILALVRQQGAKLKRIRDTVAGVSSSHDMKEENSGTARKRLDTELPHQTESLG